MSNFSALLDELAGLGAARDEMNKALAAKSDADDKKIAEAAPEKDDAAGEAQESDAEASAEAKAEPAKDEASEKEEGFAKSFAVTLEDGSTVEAYDGTAMFKSLAAENVALKAKMESTEGEMLKALQAATAQIAGVQASLHAQAETVQAQSTLIKSLQADIARLGNQGAGRKASLSIHDKPATTTEMSKSEGIMPRELLMKSNIAMTAGKISGQEACRVESYINNGIAGQLPADLLARIVA